MSRLLLPVLALTLAACEAPPPDAPLAVAGAVEETADSDSSEVTSDEPSADGPDWTPYEALRGWVGHAPVRDDGTHFVLDPSVRPTLEEAFAVEPGLMDRLASLDQELTFHAEPVDFAGGAFALAFAPAEGQDDARSLWVLIEAETGAVFALLAGDGNTYYRASYDARVADLRPEAIAWMETQSGEAFGELARMSEDAPMSP